MTQIAETQRFANIAAKRAVIDYSTENLDAPILSIEEAVKRCSYFETPPFLLPQKIGDFSKGMAEADQKIYSEVHFLHQFGLWINYFNVKQSMCLSTSLHNHWLN